MIELIPGIALPHCSISRLSQLEMVELRKQIDQQRAFDNLKKKLTTAPKLLLLDSSKSLIVITNAFDITNSMVLSQDQGSGEHPVTFKSWKLIGVELSNNITSIIVNLAELQ